MNNNSPLDFEQINSLALANIHSLLQKYIPGGKLNGREYTPLNPTRSDKHIGSFSINTQTGGWSDFATGDKGGDCISLIAYILRTNQYQAAKELYSFFNIYSQKNISNNISSTCNDKIIVEYIADRTIPKPNLVHPVHGKPSHYWIYHSDIGHPVFYLCRFDVKSGKKYAPLTLWKSNNEYSWEWKGYTQPYPLYDLHLITMYPKATVIIVEGEKCAEAAKLYFPTPNYVVTTFAHGAKSPHKTDFTPLHGRDVVLWPDQDLAGISCMLSISNLLGGKSCPSIQTLLQTQLG